MRDGKGRFVSSKAFAKLSQEKLDEIFKTYYFRFGLTINPNKYFLEQDGAMRLPKMGDYYIAMDGFWGDGEIFKATKNHTCDSDTKKYIVKLVSKPIKEEKIVSEEIKPVVNQEAKIMSDKTAIDKKVIAIPEFEKVPEGWEVTDFRKPVIGEDHWIGVQQAIIDNSSVLIPKLFVLANQKYDIRGDKTALVTASMETLWEGRRWILEKVKSKRELAMDKLKMFMVERVVRPSDEIILSDIIKDLE